ncbi:putative paraflagellar rod protein 3, partial [Trypanosoma grayi]|uniref:putative paraflagellar rod protein 3 n=1 Tax=Trypanosoma grayi TaxID=71804 RepID=UPI0004F49421
MLRRASAVNAAASLTADGAAVLRGAPRGFCFNHDTMEMGRASCRYVCDHAHLLLLSWCGTLLPDPHPHPRPFLILFSGPVSLFHSPSKAKRSTQPTSANKRAMSQKDVQDVVAPEDQQQPAVPEVTDVTLEAARKQKIHNLKLKTSCLSNEEFIQDLHVSDWSETQKQKLQAAHEKAQELLGA